MTQVMERPRAAERDRGDELVHSVWENAPDRALCGADVSGQPWADAKVDGMALCAVCEEILAMWEGWAE
jgi:hypothetical protein